MKKKAASVKENQSRNPKKPARIGAQERSSDESISSTSEDVIELILRDHQPLKKLIENLKNADVSRSEKEDCFEKFVPLLIGHAKAEEQSLYVQMKEFKNLRMESFEGDTEHAIAEQLIQEINGAADDDEWSAKVKVVAELVDNHIQEEEEGILKDVKTQMDISLRRAVGEVYSQIKTELELLSRPRQQKERKSMGHQLN